ncbi:RNA pseudouridylate synthase domain-containing protein 4-like isoform X2 [Acanthaster planci]|uniref:Pseudouridylate synthase RPUSD4, mitochondrial n=1 Tax=Acanthaster planci TaxID=133434 RepID=A0A8B7YVV0_ACAPL|nr:RNA pseudouridylate synthase domain-containing protein 4-like isoform X2 [Acanthaster planci]
MAAPLVRVLVLSCHGTFYPSLRCFRHFPLEGASHIKDLRFCHPVRAFVSQWCLRSPRTYTGAEVSSSAAGKSRHAQHSPGSAVFSDTESRASDSDDFQHATSDQQTSSPFDGNREGEVSEKDVRIYSDKSWASVPRRRRQEKEVQSLPDDAPANAKTVAMKIRREQILERKIKEKSRSASSDEHNQKNADQSVPTKRRDLDSKGFRNLRHQVQDLSRFQEDTVASILFRSVIYNEGELIAIDKPYGLPSHGGPGVVHSVDSLLPLLAKKLRLEKSNPHWKLYLVHRLDKETTGVMLLAKTEDMAQRLHHMFVRHQVGKKYWLVTVGVPDPQEGVIDMPMVEREVAGKHRMGIRPDIGAVYKNLGRLGRGEGTRAVTNFRVINENDHAALVEVRPETGVKHQIRVHMALGMDCPVLGDHKYSHHSKLAPQRLPMAILHQLGIRQAKARTVPMHLHAREIKLPEFLNGKNLYIATRVPRFFQQNMKRLKLKVP